MILLKILILTIMKGLFRLEAYVMPEKLFLEKALLANGFTKMKNQVMQKNWVGMDNIKTDYYVLENS